MSFVRIDCCDALSCISADSRAAEASCKINFGLIRMLKWLKSVGEKVKALLMRIRIFFMYNWMLKPMIKKMSKYVVNIATIKQESFPLGKSLFVFPGKGDILYFVLFKESEKISILEIYDEVLNRLPERYNILQKITFQDLLPSH